MNFSSKIDLSSKFNLIFQTPKKAMRHKRKWHISRILDVGACTYRYQTLRIAELSQHLAKYYLLYKRLSAGSMNLLKLFHTNVWDYSLSIYMYYLHQILTSIFSNIYLRYSNILKKLFVLFSSYPPVGLNDSADYRRAFPSLILLKNILEHR